MVLYSENTIIWLVVVEPTHLKNMSQIGFIFPNFRGENKKYLSCHHLDYILRVVICDQQFQRTILLMVGLTYRVSI